MLPWFTSPHGNPPAPAAAADLLIAARSAALSRFLLLLARRPRNSNRFSPYRGFVTEVTRRSRNVPVRCRTGGAWPPCGSREELLLATIKFLTLHKSPSNQVIHKQEHGVPGYHHPRCPPPPLVVLASSRAESDFGSASQYPAGTSSR